jgi:glutamine synthetase adenylyltransferase
MLADVVLRDAAGDTQAIWEAVQIARELFPDSASGDDATLAEQALRQLYREGLVTFHGRDLVGQWPVVDVSREEKPLAPEEIDASLSASWWRRQPYERPPNDQTIWFDATEKGIAATM